MDRTIAAVIACAALIGVQATAHARELCVVCAGPDVTYRCQIEGATPGRAETGDQVLCITTLAKDGGHASCSVRRAETGPCDGLPWVIARPIEAEPEPEMPAPTVAGTAEPPIAAAPAEPAPATTDAAPEKPAAPKTVEDLAQETAKTSGEGLKKAGDAVAGTAKAAGKKIEQAGDAVAGAAKKTWSCVTSLFTNCK